MARRFWPLGSRSSAPRFGSASSIEEATLESGALAEDKGIHLELPPPTEMTLALDRKVTLSALNNLLRNAVKFTPPGGRISMRLRRGESQVSIEVQDSCGGIAAESLETLFAPFKQGGSDRSGFGLGLSIARQAAAAHGGSLDVTNLPGEGCIFTLTLPLGT